jgi:hypothetical protein
MGYAGGAGDAYHTIYHPGFLVHHLQAGHGAGLDAIPASAALLLVDDDLRKRPYIGMNGKVGLGELL